MALVLALLSFYEKKIKHPPKRDEHMGNLSARHTAHSPKRTTNNLKSKPTNSHHERGEPYGAGHALRPTKVTD